MRSPLLPLLLCCTACSSSKSNATLVLIPGQETDAFTREPKPTRLEIRTLSSSDVRQTITSIDWPTGGFDIGELPLDQVAALEAVGSTATGDAVLRGRTLPMSMSALNGAQVPLFMGRVDEMARPPGLLPASRTAGVAGIVDGQLLVLAGGTDVMDASGNAVPATSTAAYDLGLWAPLSGVPSLPRVPTTMAIVSLHYALLIDEQGASWVNFDTSASTAIQPPVGMSFADVAGALPVQGPDGASYVVGATRRQGAASSTVLRVGADLALSKISLSAARAGAAAAWVGGVGLLVVGGSSTAAGAELLKIGSSEFKPLALGPIPVSGAGATALDATHLLVVGGVDDQGAPALARTFDPSCAEACGSQLLAGSESSGLGAAYAWALSNTSALIVGTAPPSDPDAGQSRVVLLSINGPNAQATQVAIREPRRGAIAVALPMGTIAIAGGTSPSGQPVRSIELFTPAQ